MAKQLLTFAPGRHYSTVDWSDYRDCYCATATYEVVKRTAKTVTLREVWGVNQVKVGLDGARRIYNKYDPIEGRDTIVRRIKIVDGAECVSIDWDTLKATNEHRPG